ncbi:hypothetical protein [Vulcanisaeta sp. JCM 16159]|uniref:hypothetical protein n=1 Tax=Vulcanisaeta sp. JCM 16159 TaxID=1295371 RepID=UPI001FB481B7|nr:hypothetical protein [Vulcanisaeta sp. JCM 16159]
MVLTVDAYGEIDSTVIWRVKNGEFEKLLAIPAYYGSLGALWDYVSQNLNFRSSFLEGPGKVMGWRRMVRWIRMFMAGFSTFLT